MKIIIATRNPGKFIELSEILQTTGIEYIPMPDTIPEIEETGITFQKNALIKARTVYSITGLTTIADDSGLKIYALGGFPGAHSARCAGENATDTEKRDYIIKQMAGITNRNAWMCCCAVLVGPAKEISIYRECYGKILEAPRGETKPGLQYDSIFYIPELNKTFAELGNQGKSAISHRGTAFRALKKIIEM